MRAHSLVTLVAMAVLAPLTFVNAQEFPTRPIRVIVGAAAGSGTDLAPRLVAQKLTERLGWTTVVENRPGGDWVIAMQATLDAPPDGHTLLGGAGVIAITPFTQKNLPFDLLRDFQPITRISNLQSALWVANNVPVKNFNELMQWAKENPAKASVGGSGYANMLRFAFDGIRLKVNFPAEYVSYKTGATVVTDLIAGTIPMGLTGIGNAAPMQREGKMKIVLVLSQNRSPVFPDVPSIKDIGVEGISADAWLGYLTRTGVPAPIVARLNKEIAAIVQLPDVRAQFAKLGMDPLWDANPEDFRKTMRDDIASYTSVIKTLNLKFE